MVDFLTTFFLSALSYINYIIANLPTVSRAFLDSIYYVSQFFYDILFVLGVFTTGLLIVLIIFVQVFKKGTTESKLDFKKAPFVTIQIPTRNELVALECVECCLAFDYPKNKYEILIGDDSNKPEVSQKLLEFANKHKGMVRVIKRSENTGFKPGNLNNLLKFSKGEFIVVFDSDFTPKKDFLKRIIEPLTTDESISGVQAKWNFINFNQNLTTRMAAVLVYLFQDLNLQFSLIFGAGYLCGSAEAVRKKDLIALGGWREGCLTEDIEFSLRLHAAGKKIVFLNKLSCFNQVPQGPMDLYKQQMRWAHGIITSYMANFKGILVSTSMPIAKKLIIFYNAFAYLFSTVFVLLFFVGMVGIVTHPPAPLNLQNFVSEFAFDTAMTSGFMVCCAYLLFIENKISHFPKTMLASFTVGLPTSFFINMGVFRALTRQPMQWYLLNKKVKQ